MNTLVDNKTLPDIIREKTDNGRTIVDFLNQVVFDDRDDVKMHHRLRAAELLAIFGPFEAPQLFERVSHRVTPSRSSLRRLTDSKFEAELQRVIREDTDGGRSVSRFLVNVMEGEFRSFKMHHRLSASWALLRFGFSEYLVSVSIRAPRRTPPPRTISVAVQRPAPAPATASDASGSIEPPPDTHTPEVIDDDAGSPDTPSDPLTEALTSIYEAAGNASTPDEDDSATDDPNQDPDHVPDFSHWDEFEYGDSDIEPFEAEVLPRLAAKLAARRIRIQQISEDRARRARKGPTYGRPRDLTQQGPRAPPLH